MNKLVLILAAILILPACEQKSFEPGPDEVEEATVVETLHIPRQSQSDIHFGITTNGDLSVTPSNVTFPERWTVVFKCSHGKFVLDSNTNEAAPSIWEKVVVGDKVRLTYHKVYLVVSEDNVVKSRTFLKFVTTDVRKVL